MEWEKFQEVIEKLLSGMRDIDIDLESEPDQIIFTVDEKQFVYTSQEYNALSSNLSAFKNESVYIYKPNEFEILLVDARSGPGHNYEVNVADDSISYKLAAPSKEMILAFLSSVSEENIKDFRHGFLPSSFRNYFETKDGDIDLFDLILRVLRISYSLRILSISNKPSKLYKDYANSFLFNLAYDTGRVFKLMADISEASINRRQIRYRHMLKEDEMETPKLLYKSELTEQYNLALSASDPFIEFIAYYHIMEYFFEDVYERDLITSVRDILRRPEFSIKNSKEINKIIKVIQNKTRASKEGFQGTEQEALELTMEAYISQEQLCEDLHRVNPELLEYYKTHEVSFSKGNRVDLEDFTNEKMFKKLAARIYNTRNALIHNKSNETKTKERGIYHPSSDEKELQYEIPLMKIIAEEIIINSATEI